MLPRPLTSCVASAAWLVVILGLTACGSAASLTSPASASGTAAALPTNASGGAASAGVPITLPYRTTFNVKNGQGYTLHVDLERGALQPAAALHMGADVLGSACQVNDQTDAVVPVVLTATNTTSQFAATNVQVVFSLPEGVNYNTGGGLEAEYVVDGHATCAASPDASPGCFPLCVQDYASTLAPGASVSTEGFLIATAYYSPQKPAGNLAGIDSVVLTFEPTTISGWPVDPTTPASGTLPYTEPDGTVLVAFDPMSNPSCHDARAVPNC